MTLRLADPLVITSVSSVETGPLSHFRLRNQNAVIVRLPRVLQPDEGLTLLVTYSGLVRSQGLEDALQIGLDPLVIEPEPHLLLSSASYWYPQNPFTDYATATMRISVPRDFTCVASGTPGPGDPLTTDTPSDERIFTFHARQPLRYLALVVSRFTNVHRATLALGAEGGGGAVALSIDVNPLQRARARSLVAPTEEIIRFYASLLGEAPLPSMALAVVEADVPGGHSPGYMVMLNSPPFVPAVTWRNDPAAFQGFPEFFLAHELAHQWWGQTVGMKNYHERWISEGFAQYFAALYAERFRGERVFHDMLRQFRRWSLSESDKGPVHLGYRLGQLSGGSRVFRALVYNKGAGVLHMLRRLVGDDAFFLGLRRFYAAHKFRTAGTADLQRALEQEAGRPLDRFFDRWIYGSDLPRVVNRSNVVDGQAIVRLEQTGEQVFDLPVTVTLTHEDGSSRDVVAIMSEKTLEQRIESDRRVRQVRINRDSAALAEFEND
jgi:aminopeptidase N